MSDKNQSTDNLESLSDMDDKDFADLLPDEDSEAEEKAEKSPNINLLGDLPVTLSMMVDSIQLPIGNLLNLSEGQVLPLNKMANDPMDILVNGKLIARGEVVVVDGRYGVRLVEVVNKVSPGASEPKE